MVHRIADADPDHLLDALAAAVAEETPLPTGSAVLELLAACDACALEADAFTARLDTAALDALIRSGR